MKQLILIIGGKYQGKHDFVSAAFPGAGDGNIIDFRDVFEGDIDTGSLVGKDIFVIADENSSGIVPGSVEEIRYRDEYNRRLTALAKEASEVYRVFCGIGMKIK